MAGKPTTTYDVAEAFARIEAELVADMMRLLDHHRAEEAREGFLWAQWQVAQLRHIDEYARRNAYRHGRTFDKLNAIIELLIRKAYNESSEAMERRILRAIKDGWVPTKEPTEGVFGVQSERLDALVSATHSDLMRAEHSVLRQAADQYRQIVFDAQLYAASGAATYEKAIDMATGDFLARGIDSIVYSNGSRHTIREYAQMAVRTSVKRAGFVGEGDKRREWGCHYVYVNPRTDACPECMVWAGKVLIDDVYSGGEPDDGRPLLSEAMAEGLFHPNCKDTMGTWFPGVSDAPDAPSSRLIAQAEAREAREAAKDTAENNERRYARVAEYSLEERKKERYAALASKWAERAEGL